VGKSGGFYWRGGLALTGFLSMLAFPAGIFYNSIVVVFSKNCGRDIRAPHLRRITMNRPCLAENLLAKSNKGEER
jgi:hypothetical protein